MNRANFIKSLGAAALIPFVPRRNYIDTKITLVTNDDPINYRTVVHAYDMTLETIMDEYIPYDNEFLRAVTPYERRMTLSNLPSNYDKYEIAVWKTDQVGPWEARSEPGGVAFRRPVPNKVYSETYSLWFPAEIIIDLT